MKWLKVVGVICGALVITALGIDAADTLQGSRSTMLGQLVATESDGCPEGMIKLASAQTFSCVDQYEAAPGPECPVLATQNELDTKNNLNNPKCGAVAEKDATPWRFIAREQAQVACARTGKRLPTNEEWQQLAAGTPDSDTCNINTSAVTKTGNRNECMSAAGVYDAVGNVWEWTSDDVFDGQYNGRALPSEGYVLQVDRGGVATLTGTSSSALFGADYFWSKSTGAYAIMRGGFYASKDDAGVYTTHAATLPTMQGTAIGFRCVQ